MDKQAGWVLVIDSEQSLHPLYQRVLGELGYAVELCVSGPQALLALARRSFELLLIDPCISGMSAMEILMLAHRQPAPAGVLVLSAQQPDDPTAEVAEDVRGDLLQKPFDAGELRVLVEAALRERQRVQSANARLLSGGAQRLIAEDELRAFYHQVVLIIKVRFQADRVSLMLWSDGSDRINVAATAGFPFAKPGDTSASLHDSVSGWVIRHVQPLLLERDGDVPFDMQSSWRNSAICSGMCIPLSLRGRVLGVLNAARRCDRNPYNNADLDMLMAWSVVVAMMLDSWLQQSQSYRRQQFLVRLYSLSAALLGASDLDLIVNSALEHLREVYPDSHGYLFLREDESPGIDRVFALGSAGRGLPDLDELRDDPGLVGQVLADGMPRLRQMIDPRELAGWERRALDHGDQHMLCVALKTDASVYGAIELVTRHGPGNDEELQHLVAVAALLAPALEKASRHVSVAQSAARYDVMFQGAADAILLVDMQARTIVLANPAAERLSGYTQVELAAIAPSRLIAPGRSGRASPTIGDVLAGKVAEYEGYLRTRSGYNVPVLLSTSVLSLKGSAHLLLVIRNNTEYLRETQRQAQQEKLSGMTRLTAAIAHEVNNPLQALHNTLHLLLSRSYTDEKRERLLSMAHMEVDRLAAIVRRMLDLHRPADADMRPLSVHTLLDSALTSAAAQLQQNHILIERDWEERLPRVVGIGGHLKQVFYDLLINAAEAMPNGGRVRISTRVDQGADSANRVLIDFVDNGPGISDSDAQLIFDPFYSTKHTNPGLGLAVGYSIIERHGGTISVISSGSGSTFRVQLPVANGSQN